MFYTINDEFRETYLQFARYFICVGLIHVDFTCINQTYFH